MDGFAVGKNTCVKIPLLRQHAEKVKRTLADESDRTLSAEDTSEIVEATGEIIGNGEQKSHAPMIQKQYLVLFVLVLLSRIPLPPSWSK